MNEHTHRILSRMLASLEDYQQERIDLDYLVKSLEGGLNAIEEQLPPGFHSQWYTYWGGLEEILGTMKEGLIAESEARKGSLELGKPLALLIESELRRS